MAGGQHSHEKINGGHSSGSIAAFTTALLAAVVASTVTASSITIGAPDVHAAPHWLAHQAAF